MPVQVPQNIDNIDVLYSVSACSIQDYPFFLFQKDLKILAWLKTVFKEMFF